MSGVSGVRSGRARLATKPLPTGSIAIAKTIGISTSRIASSHWVRCSHLKIAPWANERITAGILHTRSRFIFCIAPITS
jgi:hypothetical protein